MYILSDNNKLKKIIINEFLFTNNIFPKNNNARKIRNENSR